MNETDEPRKPRYPSHRRRGRRWVPPLADLGVPVERHQFAKRNWPDFLWLLTMLQASPLAHGPGSTGLAIEVGQAATKRAHARGALGDDQVPVFHGLLTDWERLPAQERRETLARLRQLGAYDQVVPVGLAHALATLPDAPGRWLVEPRLANGMRPSHEEAEKHLWEIMRLGGSSDQELAMHAVYVWLLGLVREARITYAPDPVWTDVLPRYPNVSHEDRARAESVLRASFLAIQGAAPNDRTEEWCRRFWRASGRLFTCLRRPTEPPDPPDLDKAATAGERLADLQHGFLLASSQVDLDLWEPDRHDVLLGMTWRALRIAQRVVADPSQWSEEHGYGQLRSLCEAFIQLSWMLSVEAARPTVWTEFKNYGRGRAKAFKLDLDLIRSTMTGEPRQMMDGLAAALDQDVRREVPDDFQDISTATTFVDDVSLGRMAEDVGLGAVYRATFQPSSSAIHGDWSALDQLVLDRCAHILHGPHALPRLTAAPESEETIPYLCESYAERMLDLYSAANGWTARDAADDKHGPQREPDVPPTGQAGSSDL